MSLASKLAGKAAFFGGVALGFAAISLNSGCAGPTGAGRIWAQETDLVSKTGDFAAYVLGNRSVLEDMRQPAAQQQISTAQNRLFSSNGTIDRNKNGMLDYPDDFINPGQAHFTADSPKFIVFYRMNNNNPVAVKLRMRHIDSNSEEEESNYNVIGANECRSYDLSFLRNAGTYSISAVDINGNTLVQIYFEIADSRLSIVN